MKKHKELLATRERLEQEVSRITVAIAHVEATLRLFDPDSARELALDVPYRQTGLKRFILDALREAREPMTVRQIAKAWMERQGIPEDKEAVARTRLRVSAAIKKSEAQGILEHVGFTPREEPGSQLKRWAVAKEGGR
jgi:hypothetical protein